MNPANKACLGLNEYPVPEPSANSHFIKISPSCFPIFILVLEILIRLVGGNNDEVGITIYWKWHLMPRADMHDNTCRSIKVKTLDIVKIRMWLLALIPASVRPALSWLAKHHKEWFPGKWDEGLGM